LLDPLCSCGSALRDMRLTSVKYGDWRGGRASASGVRDALSVGSGGRGGGRVGAPRSIIPLRREDSTASSNAASIRNRSTNLRFALVRWPHPRGLPPASTELARAGGTGGRFHLMCKAPKRPLTQVTNRPPRKSCIQAGKSLVLDVFFEMLGNCFRH
jgi:hypothetical protein